MLIEFTNCGFDILRKGLLNRPKHKASSKVDLPEPFSPTIKELFLLSSLTSVK